MTTDITELAQSLKAAAEKWQEAWGKYDKVEITIAEFIRAANQYESIVKDPANILALAEALEKAQQHIARQEQILLNKDESLSIRRGELEAAQQERENWRTSFDNERFRADKLKAHIDEMTEEQTASINELSRIIQREIKSKREAEKRIAELESRTVTVKPMRPGHITVGGEKLGIYMRDEVDEFLAALTAAGIKWEAE
ncbi:TPA: hypothetical protein IB025_001393 [Escherichia coli]|nr:hypothetical protein [Escherichia coli]